MSTETLAIIIPCYNEQIRLSICAFEQYLSTNPNHFILFVDDGSTDNTPELLAQINKSFPLNTQILTFTKNRGKSFSIAKAAAQILNESNFNYIGYLDSDLSTNFSDFIRIFEHLLKTNADYAFGSRIKLKNANIKRKAHRHIIGRLIATVIDLKFRLKIYDTQCGAKIFNANLARVIFKEPFRSNWLFDVELFIRIRDTFPEAIGIEIPLLKWCEIKGSKINLLSATSVLKDLFNIYRHYK